MSMPSRRLIFCCFPLLVLYCACFQLPSLSGAENRDATSTISCNSSSLKQCKNLGNNPYPFSDSAACAASASYVIASCTHSDSTEAHWDTFSDAALGVVGSPVVTYVTDLNGPEGAASSLSYSGYVTFELSWNTSLVGLGPCPLLFSSSNLALYNIPSSINLTRIPDSPALNFTEDNAIFLFNCTRNASDVMRQGLTDLQEVFNDSGCTPYEVLCYRGLAKMPCIKWEVSSFQKVLMLQHVLDTLACPYFMIGTPSLNQFNSYTTFTPAVFEFLWTDRQCYKCTGAGGHCIYEAAFPQKIGHCKCDDGSEIDFETQTCHKYSPDDFCGPPPCTGGGQSHYTDTVVKVVVGVAVGIVGVLGIYILIKVGLPVGFGILKKSTRKLQSVTVPVMISILKNILRKLQSISPRHGRFLDLLDLDGLTERPTEYSYGFLSSATKSFSNLVGEGGFSTVYKGTITTVQASKSHGNAGSEQQIAVKVLESKSKHSKTQFLNEVVTIGKIHHLNVVRLLGFCMQEDHEMLVYEYVVNGSLDKWLFDKKGKPQEQVLDWGQRFEIALGVARGLSYLHEECRHRTVHCDIKPQNILLDAEMHPKIADFGLARLMSRDESKVVTFAKGTPGYMAPEFWRGGEGQLSTKFDVYSYGMVLLELISGQRNFDAAVAMASGSSFPARAFKAAMEGYLELIIDPKLDIMSVDVNEAQKHMQWQQVKTATFIALWCIQDHPAGRPCMSEVVMYLEGGAAVSEGPPQPTICISNCASYPHQQELHTVGSHHDYECTPLSIGR